MNRFYSFISAFASFILIGNVSTSNAQHRFPTDKVPLVNGEYIMFSSTPLQSPEDLPLSLKSFVDYAKLHIVSSLPPYATNLNDFVLNKYAERLDTITIANENGGGNVIAFEYDTLGNVVGQTIKESGKMYADIKIMRDARSVETERIITFANGDKMHYKFLNGKPVLYELYEGGRATEKINWVYKNSVPVTASASSSLDGRSSVKFNYTPQKRISSIEVKKKGEVSTTLYNYSDYESSVNNPIIYKLDAKASASKPYNVYTQFVEGTNDTYVRKTTLTEKNILKIHEGETIDLVSCYLTFETYSTGGGNTKNMLSRTMIKNPDSSLLIDESYSYYPNLKLKAISGSIDGEVQYIYNKDGNVKLIMHITKDGSHQTMNFHYTNFEEERLKREAEEKEKAEREAQEALEKEQAEKAAQEAQENENSEKKSEEGNTTPAE